MMGFVALLMLLVVAAVIAAGAWTRPSGTSARGRLDERLATGDLTVEEHADRVEVLLGKRSGRRGAPWAAIAVAAVVVLVVGILGWAAGGTSMGWWGDRGWVMGDHMGWTTSSGDADPPVAGARDVEVVATDLVFTPDVIEIGADEPVNITLSNDGAVFHDLSIPELGFMLDADPGQQVLGSLTVDEAGTYEFVCSVPGHAQAGMRGTLQVVSEQ